VRRRDESREDTESEHLYLQSVYPR